MGQKNRLGDIFWKYVFEAPLGAIRRNWIREHWLVLDRRSLPTGALSRRRDTHARRRRDGMYKLVTKVSKRKLKAMSLERYMLSYNLENGYDLLTDL
jgi:hypothetical protein